MSTIANIPASFITAMRERLAARGVAAVIHDDEMPLLAAARQHGVGADDTACQIIANREDTAFRKLGRRGRRGVR